MAEKVKELSAVDKIVKAIKEGKTSECHHHSSPSCGVYGLGLLGAAYYYFQHMPANSDILFTIFKIIFWPAFLVYRLLERNIF